MAKLLTIRGGKPLQGEVHVRGAKNLVPKAMVASLLGSETSEMRNVPEIKDVEIVTNLLTIHGVKVERDPEAGIMRLDPRETYSAEHAEDRRLCRGLPDSDPLLRSADAQERRSVHPRSGRLPYR